MNSRICRCCGEPMPEQGNALSRNPNICASCSSMADGMEEAGVPQHARQTPETAEVPIAERPGEHKSEPAFYQVST